MNNKYLTKTLLIINSYHKMPSSFFFFRFVVCYLVLKIELLDPLQSYLIKYNPGTSGVLLTNRLKLLATANYDSFSLILPNIVSQILWMILLIKMCFFTDDAGHCTVSQMVWLIAHNKLWPSHLWIFCLLSPKILMVTKWATSSLLLLNHNNFCWDG